eukprot:Unigene9466_Nuclearia_a/m.28907 Unigene9466_Nuclearia_a/g.28907  ORF Unigene9466_Nuclearia_a/g.28907 Unigene9466_Nuclearia_a/m.28907 type:complete len:310 (+) Unigene9466_Nuclearia_a:189-1118(+)
MRLRSSLTCRASSLRSAMIASTCASSSLILSLRLSRNLRAAMRQRSLRRIFLVITISGGSSWPLRLRGTVRCAYLNDVVSRPESVSDVLLLRRLISGVAGELGVAGAGCAALSMAACTSIDTESVRCTIGSGVAEFIIVYAPSITLSSCRLSRRLGPSPTPRIGSLLAPSLPKLERTCAASSVGWAMSASGELLMVVVTGNDVMLPPPAPSIALQNDDSEPLRESTESLCCGSEPRKPMSVPDEPIRSSGAGLLDPPASAAAAAAGAAAAAAFLTSLLNGLCSLRPPTASAVPPAGVGTSDRGPLSAAA